MEEKRTEKLIASDLEMMSEKMQDEIIHKTQDMTRETLWDGKEWVADYRRLRAIAHK